MEIQEQEKEQKTVKRRGRPKGSKNKKKDVEKGLKAASVSAESGSEVSAAVAAEAGSEVNASASKKQSPRSNAAVKKPAAAKRSSEAEAAAGAEEAAKQLSEVKTAVSETAPEPKRKRKSPAKSADLSDAPEKAAASSKASEKTSEKAPDKSSEKPSASEETPARAAEPAVEVKKRRKKPTTTYVNSIVGMVDINSVGASFVIDEQPVYGGEGDALPLKQTKSIEEEPQAFENVVAHHESKEISGVKVEGVFEFADPTKNEYGFLRRNGISSENDIYVSPSFARKFNLKSGEYVKGIAKAELTERYRALLFVNEVNGVPPYMSRSNNKFDDMTPLFPRERFHLSMNSSDIAMRIIDLIAPVGKGQRGLIVAPPKSGKTILLQKIARSIKENYPDVELMILLIDERPEEVTDMKDVVDAPVFYSTFDELPQNHIRIAELVLNRARGLVEMGKDVVILLDSITRLARAYNIALPASGRTLSGGLDTNALHKPKRFLGSARNMQEGGSLTIMATALIETGSKMDDVIFEEFKGTGNMELILDRKLSEKRIFPSIDIRRSGTRREELLLNRDEYEAVLRLRRAFDQYNTNEPVELLSEELMRNRTNEELVNWINTAFADKTTRK